MKQKSKFQKRCLALGLILIFGAATISCAGLQTYPFDATDKKLAGWVIFSGLADAYTTDVAINQREGFRELNPIFGSQPSTERIYLTIGISRLLILGLSRYIEPKTRKWLLGLSGGLSTVAAIHNWRLLND